MSVRNKPVKYTYANHVSSVGKALHQYRRGHGFKSRMTWTFRALFSLLRRSLSYSFLNLQFPYMIFINSHLSISFLFCIQEPRLRNMREISLPLSTALRRLLSTALRFRRYSLALTQRSVLLHFTQDLELMQIPILPHT